MRELHSLGADVQPHSFERERQKHGSGGLTAAGDERPRAGDDRETPLS